MTHPTVTAYAAEISANQRELAFAIDTLISRYLHTSCVDGECEQAWELIVKYSTTGNAPHSPDPDISSLCQQVLSLARELGGFWTGGCAYRAGMLGDLENLARLTGFEDDDDPGFADLTAGKANLPTWVSLDEMAQRTGRPLGGR
jgi:hypothetical protein